MIMGQPESSCGLCYESSTKIITAIINHIITMIIISNIIIIIITTTICSIIIISLLFSIIPTIVNITLISVPCFWIVSRADQVAAEWSRDHPGEQGEHDQAEATG